MLNKNNFLVLYVFILFIILYLKTKKNKFYNNKNKNLIKIPIFYINLKKDKERLTSIKNTLSNIFDSNYIYRIEGVQHKLGLEGCRLAHIKANKEAIKKGYDYYIIAEDDIKQLVNKKKIIKHIYNSILFNPDLVLFEQGEKLETKIKLQKKTNNMYRIFSGGNAAGIYLCSLNFGKKLVNHWENNKFIHIDHSWQELWKTNNVYFYRPQLFNQKEGKSNQSDVNYRNETKPFDWELYYKINRTKY